MISVSTYSTETAMGKMTLGQHDFRGLERWW